MERATVTIHANDGAWFQLFRSIEQLAGSRQDQIAMEISYTEQQHLQRLSFGSIGSDWEISQEQVDQPCVDSGFHDSYVPTSSFEVQRAFDEVTTLDHVNESKKAEILAKKSPLMYFRELFPNAASQLITQQTCEEFVGEGRSKQLSKHAMAKSVLAKICPSDLQYLQRLKGETDIQTCNNEPADGLPLEQKQELVPTESKVAEPIQTKGSSSHLVPSTELASKPACQLLWELCQGRSVGSLPIFEVSKLENNKVACKITIGQRSVEVVCKGRKVAKNLAATKALRELLNVEPQWLEKAENERNKAAIIGLDAQHALMKLCAQKCMPLKFHSEMLVQPKRQMKVVCQVGEEIFEAVGSKRKVRTLVSTNALKKVFNIDYNSFAGAGGSHQVLQKDMYNKSPAQLLNELVTSQGHSPVEYAEAQTFQEGLGFRASAKFNDEEYEGWAPSKKKAKQEVARSILLNAFQVSFPNAQ
uniref:DRBM domain-containing protein n=1 Tax=Trichuris muris TaxID=70415 RepID=A0A5S6Q6R3_TRIMR